MVFAIIILSGAILLNLPVASRNSESIGFVDALFTSTSAVCVTGLVVVDTYTHYTAFGQIVILSLIQIGGLGFMTMATLFSFLLRRKISYSERLVMAESLNQDNLQGIVKQVKRILLGTLFFESLGAILLSIRFIKDFGFWGGITKGIFHAVSAFCNAGFDIMGSRGEYSSLTTYSEDIIVNVVIMLLIIIGGIGFIVWNDIYTHRKFKNFSLHSKLAVVTTIILILFGFISIFLVESSNPATMGGMSFKGKILASFFQSVTPRTAGYNTINLVGMKDTTVFVTMILMFIGGSPGSTAGGIKTTTFGVLLFTIIASLKGKSDTEMFERRISNSTVTRAITITFIGAVVVALCTVVLSIFDNVSLTKAAFESFSAFGTVGLSLGVTPGLSDVSKIALIVSMYLGRVGVLTFALSLLSIAHKNYYNFRYKEDKIMLG